MFCSKIAPFVRSILVCLLEGYLIGGAHYLLNVVCNKYNAFPNRQLVRASSVIILLTTKYLMLPDCIFFRFVVIKRNHITVTV